MKLIRRAIQHRKEGWPEMFSEGKKSRSWTARLQNPYCWATRIKKSICWSFNK
jgi:hypothetical protein